MTCDTGIRHYAENSFNKCFYGFAKVPSTCRTTGYSVSSQTVYLARNIAYVKKNAHITQDSHGRVCPR
jgi:hypothetical protein